jgi:protein-tyrosine phosphatase
VDPAVYLAARYAEVASDGAAEMGRALEIIAGSDGPVVFHRTSGKDRTGLLAAEYGSVRSYVAERLGVSDAVVTALRGRLLAT